MARRPDGPRVRGHAGRRAEPAPRSRHRYGRAGRLASTGRRAPGRHFGGAAAGARGRLRGFRQATILAIAVTAFLLLLLAPEHAGLAQEPPSPEPAPAGSPVAQADIPPEELPRATVDEARHAMAELWLSFMRNLPGILVAVAVFLVAWLLHRVLRPVLRRLLRSFDRANAITALVGFAIWILAIGIALSVLVGDIRALVGSLGLVGLALSWALQTPIESFTGWLLNSFQGYYRTGDRVAVGEVFGDVYRIDVLTTTVWEIGSPTQEGAVAAEQPTGRLITFPNYEVLRGSIVNLTRDFPYVWDELTVPVGNRSDLDYATKLLERVAGSVLGEAMGGPAREYEAILRAARLEVAIAHQPQIFISLDDSWTNLTIRYLIAARERRQWTTRLARAVMEELARPEHDDRIVSVFPRRQVQLIGPDGKPREPPGPVA